MQKNNSMAKRAFLIHGWGGSPQRDFLGWLKQELEKNGYSVEIPSMPESEHPRIEKWIPFLVDTIKNPDDETIIVGHSMGALAGLMFLEKIPPGTKIDKLVMVAGVLKKITNLDSPEEQGIAKPWLSAKLDSQKIHNTAKEIIGIYSDNDKYVPLENSEIAYKEFGTRIIIEKNMGHYTQKSGVTEVPTVLAAILEN